MDGGPDMGALVQDDAFSAGRGNLTPTTLW